VRVFKTKWFSRFARNESLSNKKLAEAIREIEAGLHDGDLGSGIIKKRMARAGEGKRGGYRALIVYQKNTRAVFVYGYAKNAQADLSPVELREYQKAAQIYLRLSETDIGKALQEIGYEEETLSE
jgi:hypothetical protein